LKVATLDHKEEGRKNLFESQIAGGPIKYQRV
jgi:hypothetical protein